MPNPERNEKKSDFIKRCVPQLISEGKSQDQAVAVCYAMWEKHEENMKEMSAMELAKWSTAYINALPDSAFVIIEPAYLQGKTKDKRARHLPYKDAEGNVDLPHLRNAMTRVSQLKPVTGSITTAELRKKASEILVKLAKKYLKK